MLRILGAICQRFTCTSSDSILASTRTNNYKVSPTTPERDLKQAITERKIDNVAIALSRFHENASPSKEAIELFIHILFTPSYEEDDFTSQVQKELIKFIINYQHFDEKTILDEGKTLEQILEAADEKNGTQLAIFLKQQIKLSCSDSDSEHILTASTSLRFTSQNSSNNSQTNRIWLQENHELPGAINPTFDLYLETPQKTINKIPMREMTTLIDSTPKIVKNFKLLVIEDSTAIVKILMKRFKDSDIDIYWVNNSAEGLKAMQGNNFCSAGHCISSSGNSDAIYTPEDLTQNQGIKFDLVLQDFELGAGQMSGPELVREYRILEYAQNLVDKSRKRLPILTFSTNVDTTNQAIPEEHRSNFDGIVNKPGLNTQTFQALHAILGDEYIQWTTPDTSTRTSDH